MSRQGSRCLQCDASLVQFRLHPNGATLVLPQRTPPIPATESQYHARFDCACCRFPLDDNQLSHAQTVDGGRLRRCTACKRQRTNLYGDSLFSKLLEINSAVDVQDRLNQVGYPVCNREFAAEEDLKNAEAESVQTKSRIIRETFGLGPQYRRSWVQIDAPEKEVVITPQLKDDVVFFPNAYIDFLRDRDYLEEIVPYYCFDGVLSRCFAVKCRVVDVRNLFPDCDDFDNDRLVMTELTLAVLAVPKDAMEVTSRQWKRRHGESDEPMHMYDLVEPTFGQFVGVNASLSRLSSNATPAQRHNIRVLCHTSHVEDFLVLDAKFEMSIRAGWNVGDRIETSMISLDMHADPFNAKRYTRTIESITHTITKQRAISCRFLTNPATSAP